MLLMNPFEDGDCVCCWLMVGIGLGAGGIG